MRATLLWLVLLVVPGLAGAQAVIIHEAPPFAPYFTQLRMPNGLASDKYMRGHFLLTADDLALMPAGVPLTSFGMNFVYGTNTPAGGSFSVYLENTNDTTNLKSTTWTTAVATMSAVYTGTLELPVGAAPASIDLALTGPSFTYTGGGLYVAFEYTGSTFATGAAAYSANSDLADATHMASSMLELPATLTSSSAFRPQVRLGYLNARDNQLAVTLSVMFGDLNATWDDEVDVNVANAGRLDSAGVDVLLTVTGANSDSRSLPTGAIATGDSVTLNVPMAYAAQGEQTIAATLPADEVPSDDEASVAQSVSCNVLSYAGAQQAPYDSVGFGTGAGILAVRYTAPAVPVRVDGVYAELSISASNAGNTVYGRLLDADGVIAGSSEPVVIAPEQPGTRVYFPFVTPVELAPAARMFAGLEQTPSPTAYYPVATVAPADVPDDRVYSFPPTGGAGAPLTNLGTLKLGIEAVPVVTLQVGVDGHAVQGEPVDIVATPGYDTYEFFVNGVSVQSGTSGTLTYVAQDLDLVSVTATRNACDAQVQTQVSVIIPDEIFLDGFDGVPDPPTRVQKNGPRRAARLSRTM